VTLAQGWLADEGGGVLALMPREGTVLPQRRQVTGLRVTHLTRASAAPQLWPSQLPLLDLSVGQPWELADPDQVVRVNEPARLIPEGMATTVLAPAGVHRVSVLSGTTKTLLEVSWAPGFNSVLAEGAAAILDSGRVADAAQALVLSEALARSLISSPNQAHDLLAELPDDPTSVLGCAVLAARGQRSGKASLVERAMLGLARTHPGIGYGRVVLGVWLASLAVGLDLQEQAMSLLGRPAAGELAALEQSLVHFRSREVAEPLLDGVVWGLGGELPGRPWGLGLTEQAQQVGLLALCPEEWGIAALAGRTAAKNRGRILAELVGTGLAAAEPLAWLVITEGLC
ncbi:MAG: hypothetical protein WAS07_13535, partial [Micropruina sp.]